MEYEFRLSRLQRLTNPGAAIMGQLMCGFAAFLYAIGLITELNSGLLGLLVLLLGIFLFLTSVAKNPKVGALISVTITPDEIRYYDGKERCVFQRKSLTLNGVRNGLFGCGTISLTSGHSLLIPSEGVEPIKQFLRSDVTS